MKTYWTIQGPSKAPRKPCVAFYKYDGSNLRWEWSRKRGWYKFGCRRRLIDERDEQFGKAVPLFLNNYADDLEKVFKHKSFRNIQSIIVFTEFFGPNSFAGEHVDEDPKELRLLDVSLHKKGLLGPTEFLNRFGHLSFVAEIVYEGNLNDSFIASVRNGEYDVIEGVVCKGGSGHKLWMVKIKTNEYKKRLIEKFGNEHWTKFWE